MIAIRMKKFYKKTGRRVRVDGKTPIGFDKKKLKCFNYHNTGHFARECTAKGTHDGKKKRASFYQHQEARKQEQNQMGLLTMDDGIIPGMILPCNLWRLFNSGMSSNNNLLRYEIQLNDEVLSRFTKTNDFKGVPHPLSVDYTPKPQEEIDDSFEGSCGNTSEHSFVTESESISVPNEMSTAENVVSKVQEVEPSCAKTTSLKNMVDRGIFSGCSGGNMDRNGDFKEFPQRHKNEKDLDLGLSKRKRSSSTVT
ncbi:ribonuclease H-like domain-containing protein [Tanacetum coccineum]